MASDAILRAVLEMLSESYPGRFQVGDATLAIWARLLADLPDEALMTAAVQHVTENQWPPSIAELRTAAFDALTGDVLTAGEAWALVTSRADVCRYLPEEQIVEEMGAFLHRCVMALGGWSCARDGFDRALFVRTYDELLERELRQARALPEVRDVVAHLRAGGRLALAEGAPGDA